jgi:glycosyltransferase involved in cell wall biosynthesis
MYWALWNLGDINGSRTHFNACYGYQPYNSKYLHDLRFYTKLPKVSFIIPTLGREEGLKRCIESIKKLNYPLENIQLVIIHDGEKDYEWERDTKNFKMFAKTCVVRMHNESIGVPKTVAKGLELVDGEWIVYASNDIEFTPDSLIIALETARANSKSLAAFNTGEVLLDKGNICEHFLIKRSFIDKIGGEIFDTEFHHVGVDNLLWAKTDKQMQAMRVGRAIAVHHHFSTGADFDEVYKKAWNEENVKHDRELLAKKLEELNNPII